MEYSPRIEQLISELLAARGTVAPESLPGIPDEDGAQFLAHYAAVSGGAASWDGARLSANPGQQADLPARPESAAGSTPERTSVAASTRSPVDEILSAPVGASMLDTKPAGRPVPMWMWLLPLTFLLPGGVVAWWMTRETNRTISWLLLLTGVVMTIITVASGPIVRDMMAPMIQSVTM